MIAALLLAQDSFAGVSYEKLATRAASEAAALASVRPFEPAWSEWHLLGPFAFAGHDRDDLAVPRAPEAELAQLRAGGPGPELQRSYAGKDGAELRWRPLGRSGQGKIDLRSGDEARDDLSIGYLYASVTVAESVLLPMSFGADDGLRLWINGRLWIDDDAAQGLDPEKYQLKVPLAPGRNHFLAKVSNGAGGWEFAAGLTMRLDPRLESWLQWRLDRDFPSAEGRYYRILTLPLPEDVVLEAGGLDFLPDGRPIACTRRGDLWIVNDAYDEPPLRASYTRFAAGLHEPLGLAVRVEDGRAVVYCAQRPELTRLRDDDGDDRADRYECFSSAWGLSGNYHEFAFGPKFDAEGNAWVTLNVGFDGVAPLSEAPYRGWCVKITPQGEMLPVCSGLRSPNGLGRLPNGEFFFLDNQGDYVGTNKLSHLVPGSWQGNPASLRWREDWRAGGPPPERTDPAVWFPYKKMGQSPADFLYDDTAGKFGPFSGQVFTGDMTACTLMRVFLEQVDGVYQGACFPFLENFASGPNRLAFAPDASLFVGMTDRGWGSVGQKRYGLQRVVWTGLTPFEVRAMRVTPQGFELEFTQDFDPGTANRPDAYRLLSYTYKYHAEYGSPEVDAAPQAITAVEVVDPRTVRLRVERLKPGYVHELHLPGPRSGGAPLLHPVAYYTLKRIPRSR